MSEPDAPPSPPAENGREKNWKTFLVQEWSLLLLAEVVIRLLFPSYRRPVLGTTILAIVFLAIGIGSWGLIWPLVLIIIGLALLFGGLFRRK